MSALWTDQQREWLQAMGHQLWSLASADVPAVMDEPVRPAGAMREAAELLGREHRTARPAPSQPTATADRLLQALMRAAGRGVDDATLAALVPDVSALRGNAAAKRALWPRLRALRKREQNG